ncbi:monovalent cation/H(+) antiporter subunit G [Geodermatophilus marinus]|uniref:monovalent cation/H(+) antiporter subunit G n=1 Tax=Geodermatophilus sp. LHW52908 TaxID=2303986 RepID=UPI000E3BF3BF|nr:monovalent cation/H(+) antiporter subunit G [Geodermatophilus sp. LHW52908]RFU22309.1 Na+/H+ antiporter subunit G [Geodermatophilus sp. LHW52908]
MQTVADVVAVVLVLLGCTLALVAGLGLLRFPDVVSRLHAGTKPQVAGVLLIVLGAAIRLWGEPAMWTVLLAGFLQFLTAPLSAHMVSRIAYRRRHLRRDLLVVHEAEPPPPPPGQPRGDEPADAPAPSADHGSR